MSDTQASRDPGNTDDHFEQVDHRQTEDDKKAVPLIQEQVSLNVALIGCFRETTRGRKLLCSTRSKTHHYRESSPS